MYNTLSVFECLSEYLLRGNETKLFISCVKPHKRVARETMEKSGMDITKSKPHSTRMAATTRAKAASVPVYDILRKAGWSSSRSFGRFYDKPVMNGSYFASAVLNSVKD